MRLNGGSTVFLFRDLNLHFGGNKFKNFIRLKWSELAQNCVGNISSFLYLPLKGVIAKIALCDHVLLFGGNFFLVIYISEMIREGTKMCGRHI